MSCDILLQRAAYGGLQQIYEQKIHAALKQLVSSEGFSRVSDGQCANGLNVDTRSDSQWYG
jgi:hypothetical protein